MNWVVWKYELSVKDFQPLLIPEAFEVLDIQMQGATPCMWVLVDHTRTRVLVGIRMLGTGHPTEIKPGQYLGTVQIGNFVFHVFQEGV